MPKEPESYFVWFKPPLAHKSEQCQRAWELINELIQEKDKADLVISYVGYMAMEGIGFPTAEQAMLFKLKL